MDNSNVVLMNTIALLESDIARAVQYIEDHKSTIECNEERLKLEQEALKSMIQKLDHGRKFLDCLKGLSNG